MYTLVRTDGSNTRAVNILWKCCRKGLCKMKKTILVLAVAVMVSVNCFAQQLSEQARALQGTWALIGAMNDDESYDEQAMIAGELEIFYIFSGDSMTIRKNGEVIGPVRYEPALGYLRLGNGEVRLPYNLQGNLLILHESGYVYIYRKR